MCPAQQNSAQSRDREPRRYLLQQREYPWCNRAVDPPVPVPNTVVKHRSTDSTAGATPWEDRSVLGMISLLSTQGGAAAARQAHNLKIVRSNRTPATLRLEPYRRRYGPFA